MKTRGGPDRVRRPTPARPAAFAPPDRGAGAAGRVFWVRGAAGCGDGRRGMIVAALRPPCPPMSEDVAPAARPWRRLFVGREDELKALLGRFERAKAGDPQFIVLLGESGLGKTRLVQAFYERLAAGPDRGGHDPDDYWPGRIAVGDSLDVNPRFDPADARPRPAVPFLWWGLRWSDAGRRNDASAGCALLDARPALEPHVAPLLRGRELAEKRRGLAWAAGKMLAGLAGLGAATALHDIYEMGRGLSEARGLGADAESVGGAERRQRTELADLALDFFRAALAPDGGGDPVPAALVLDNAQAADRDPETLKFVERLAVAAKRGGWPLMILATHWEAEWRANLRDRRGHVTDPPRRFADLSALPTGAGAWEAVVLKPVPDLLAVVRAALPGLTDGQAGLVAAQAGGNPRLLDEIVRALLRRSGKYFEAGDPDGPLTARGERYVEEEAFDLHRLVADRFAALPGTVRRALGWSSVQGARFLTDLTRAAARRSDPALTDAAVTAALRDGHDPHCFVQPVGAGPDDAGAFDLGEFRQAAFLKAVREEFGDESGEVAHARAALRETLTDWLDERPTAANPAGGAKIDGLPPEERRDALTVAREHLRPADDVTDEGAWRPWGTALCHAVAHDAADHLWDRALDAARTFADARDWSGTTLPAAVLAKPAVYLVRFLDRPRAEATLRARLAVACRVADAHEGVFENGPLPGEVTPDALPRDLDAVASALADLGRLSLGGTKRDWTRDLIETAVQTRRRVLRECGGSAERRLLLARALQDLSEVERSDAELFAVWGFDRTSVERRAAARRLLEDVTEDCRAVLREGTGRATAGDLARAEDLLSLSLVRLGRLAREAGERTAARDRLAEAVAQYERTLADIADGPTDGPEPRGTAVESVIRRDHSAALLELGQAERDLGRPAAGADRLEEAVAVLRDLRAKLGETPSLSVDLARGLAELAQCEEADGRGTPACEHLREAWRLLDEVHKRWAADAPLDESFGLELLAMQWGCESFSADAPPNEDPWHDSDPDA